MQQKKRPLAWIMLVAMVFSLFPQSLLSGNVASAAEALTTYFTPDNTSISKTAELNLEDSDNAKFLTRALAYQTTSGTISITGAYAFVSKDTMRVKVEQLNSVPVTAGSTKMKWEADATRSNTTAVTASTSGNSKFTANNLTLFPGFNRVTFYGNQGAVERSDTFYVLYDQVPYIQDFKIFTDPSSGSNTSYSLNEGSQTVVNTQFVSVQGKVQNASKVTVSLNGSVELDSSLLQNGTFFTPQLKLNAGLNNLKFTIANGSDSVITERAVYYFDKNQPFSTLNVILSSNENKSVLDATPTFSTAATSAQLEVQLILPYSASNSTFKEVGTFSANGTPMTFNDVKETIIPGPDGTTPEYRLVTFKTDNSYNLQPSATVPTETAKNQTVEVAVVYGNFSAGYKGKFTHAPNVKAITNMYYLPDFDGGAVTNKVALNNAQIEKESFYILVESSQDIGTEVPTGEYLPTGTNKVNISLPTQDKVATGLTSKQAVYLVKNLANGTQQIRFYYGTPDPSYEVTVSYASKSYIYVANLYDGQTYSFNSRITHKLKIDGEFIGFSTLGSNQFVAQLLVNGLNKTVDGFPGTNGKFSFELDIAKDGPLVYGENTITIIGTDQDGAGKTKVVEKKLRIYISDSNVSNIDKFMPTLVPTDARQEFSNADVSQYTAEEMNKIFNVTPDFIIRDGKYVTSEERYDLVFKGGGAQVANLYSGSKLIFTYNPIPGTDTRDIGQQTADGHIFDFAGNQDEFMIRIRNYVFDAPGSHVYTLELINGTGARTTQRLEIVREPSSYRILSPVATVGEQIVVNKNFVHFDIEAEGATQVLINKEPATKRADMNDRFVLDYVGLKQDKSNAIKIQIIRDGSTINDTVNVFYTGTVTTDTQYMAPKVSNKYSVFNKKLELSFPKGTVLQSAAKSSSGVVKFYPDNKLLFGIADPKDGVLERKNDYGFVIGQADPRSTGGLTPITVPTILTELFNSNLNTSNFTPISDTYWISGGIGELGDKGTTGYKPGTNGVTPYSLEGSFTQFPTERILVPSTRGSLTLAYDPTIVDEVGSTITVFRYTDNTRRGEWIPVGGVVDTNKHTITVSFDEFGYYKVMKQSKSYQDITNHPWARNLLNALYSKGIMNNLRFNAFGADDQTTRGEFATLLVKGLDIPLNYTSTQTFTDVSPTTKSDTWDYASIETAARAGIITGLSDGYFGVEDSITREQAAVMIARAMSSKLAANDSKLAAALSKSFQDSRLIEYYARPSVQAITKAKIMEGSPVTIAGSTKPLYQFNPKGNLTRAEAAKIAVELLKKSTKLFPKTLS
ncbi:S-layer homology domain-containing protein [Paenibacillus marchantiae]|uniref:S-layer homology domain-containing protein n=1 Tax=Paenibacillus marchantiae TaxID=3026433 RepID=UPI00237A451B|nr:S-layer homology domain-containing protein [Paenibacillus marchantiae]WDQ33188.1 S-layer homology domain-containing protein [Paenibacillus marchantiae]